MRALSLLFFGIASAAVAQVEDDAPAPEVLRPAELAALVAPEDASHLEGAVRGEILGTTLVVWVDDCETFASDFYARWERCIREARGFRFDGAWRFVEALPDRWDEEIDRPYEIDGRICTGGSSVRGRWDLTFDATGCATIGGLHVRHRPTSTCSRTCGGTGRPVTYGDVVDFIPSREEVWGREDAPDIRGTWRLDAIGWYRVPSCEPSGS